MSKTAIEIWPGFRSNYISIILAEMPDWAHVESGVFLAMGSWMLNRFQRNPGSRPPASEHAIVIQIHALVDISTMCACM